MLSREQLLKPRALRTERVAVPELGEGESLLVRELSARARDAFEAWAVANRNGGPIPPNIRAKLVSMSIVDEATDELMLTSADVAKLGEQSAGWVDRVYDVVSRLSGIGPKEEAALKGNSEPGPGGDSSTG